MAQGSSAELLETLRNWILNGKYLAGSKFPTEREIAAKFKTTRITANKVLAILVGEGLLEFRRGIGTFVKSPKGRSESFTARMLELGIVAESHVAANRPVTRTEAVEAQQHLKVKLGDPLLFLERVRKTGTKPLRLERIVMCGKTFGGAGKDLLAGSLSAIAVELGHQVFTESVIYRATALPMADAVRLQVPPNSPALLSEAVALDESRRPLWWLRAWHRADLFQLNAEGQLEYTGN